jgi:hypothetical protein
MDLSALNFSAGTLFASLIWGTIGFGFFIYGKKQGSFIPMIGGVALTGISYFIASPLYMSLTAIGILGAMWYASKRF